MKHMSEPDRFNRADSLETGGRVIKNPWLIFAGLCSVVLAIVMVSVIFGSYTSMLRSKNRIQTGKEFMVQACMAQLERIPDLTALAPDPFDGQTLSRIDDQVEQLQTLLARFQTSNAPLDPDLVARFEDTQFLLAKDLDILTRQIGTTHPRVREMADLYLKTIYTAKRYNNEAAYFNTRKTVFPGMFTAGWFNLDKLNFPRIDLTCFEPWGMK
jgi:LemA protein